MLEQKQLRIGGMDAYIRGALICVIRMRMACSTTCNSCRTSSAPKEAFTNSPCIYVNGKVSVDVIQVEWNDNGTKLKEMD